MKTQIYINQNTEDGGTKILRHARKPSSVIQELERGIKPKETVLPEQQPVVAATFL